MSPVVYPDLLGAATNGQRLNLNAVQTALAVRPAAVAPGVPFEIIALLQNAADIPVQVTATLHLPKGFVAKKPQHTFTLAAAEAGYAVFVAACPPTTPPGDHKLGVEIEAKLGDKPRRIREQENTKINLKGVPAASIAALEELRKLKYSTAKRMGLGSPVLDVVCSVKAGQAAKPDNLTGGWVSLWTLATHEDDALLVARYSEVLKTRTFPQLRRATLMQPLHEATRARFANAGYPLEMPESIVIAKLMMLILEYAAPQYARHDPLEAGVYNLSPLLGREWTDADDSSTLPRWFRKMLRAIARDERAAQHPAQIIPKMLYDDLLRDAIHFAFDLVERATGEDVGSDEEKQDYGESLINHLNATSELNFGRVYLPLVIGGVTINDKIAVEGENVVETIRQLWTVLDKRKAECDDDTLPVHALAESAIEHALQSYGLRRSSL